MTPIIRATLFSILFLSLPAQAKVNIQWEQPEVIPEALARKNRRVLRFSGVAKAGTQVRVRKNKVKMIFSGGITRWARLPKKHRVQFPVIASETGFFSFDLYLPTTAVEVPLEIFYRGRWRPYKFAFDVPESGQARSFDFEESFRDEDSGGDVSSVDEVIADYNRSQDRGQVVDRSSSKSWITGKFHAWLGFGFSYNSISESISSPTGGIVADPGNPSDVGFPAFQFGFDYVFNPKWHLDFGYYARNATMDEDGSYNLQNDDFEWTELRLNGYFTLSAQEEASRRLSIAFGLHRHNVPFLSPTAVDAYRFFDNSILFLAAGARMETMLASDWLVDGQAMLLYPVTEGGDYELESGYGIYLGFTALKEVTPGFFLGGRAEVHWLDLEASFNTLSNNFVADMTLYHISPSFILKTEF